MNWRWGWIPKTSLVFMDYGHNQCTSLFTTARYKDAHDPRHKCLEFQIYWNLLIISIRLLTTQKHGVSNVPHNSIQRFVHTVARSLTASWCWWSPDAIIVDDRYLRRRRITARQLLNAGSFVFLASENYTQPTEGRLKANKAEFYYGSKIRIVNISNTFQHGIWWNTFVHGIWYLMKYFA